MQEIIRHICLLFTKQIRRTIARPNHSYSLNTFSKNVPNLLSTLAYTYVNLLELLSIQRSLGFSSNNNTNQIATTESSSREN